MTSVLPSRPDAASRSAPRGPAARERAVEPSSAPGAEAGARPAGAVPHEPAPKRSPEPPPKLAALKPLAPYALRYRGRIAAALLALALASLATLALPLAVRRMIDYGFGAERADLIDQYFAVLIGVVAVLAAASAARAYLVSSLGERVVADLRSAVFDHLTRLDPGYFDRVRAGEIVSRLTADTTQIKSAFGVSASIALRNVVLVIGAAAMMLATSPRLAGLMALVIPLIVLPLVASGRSVRRRAKLAQDRLADAAAFAAENVGAVRTLQAFGAGEATRARFRAAAEAAYAAAQDAARARAVLTAVALFLAFASVVGVLWIGATDVLAGRITAGTLSQFVLYAVFAASGLGALSEVWNEMSQAAGSAARIADILAERPRLVAPPAPQALPAPSPGTLAFERVRFRYPGRPDAPVLDDLSFAVRGGERVALVGPSGAGKSTVLELLLRFHDADGGVVRVDGLDVRAVDPQRLRARLALVPQDPVIFGASLLDNVRYARPEAGLKEVEAALDKAAALSFARALPEGLDTPLGERGVMLSGGQRQRVAIARAILKDAPILLLDEATSALDAESEAAVQEALDALMRGRTTLVVAHRLATVTDADRILVLDEGRLVEEGRHAELVARGGLYARLARLQFETEGAGG